jgi:hypothetical protein
MSFKRAFVTSGSSAKAFLMNLKEKVTMKNKDRGSISQGVGYGEEDVKRPAEEASSRIKRVHI